MLSIIIPTLNEEKIIEKTLKNLKEYTGPCEIIISDGKSTDRTIEIAKKYTDKVVVYIGEKRQTIAMGRNMGASIASGEYLLFLDADVYIPDINSFIPKAIDVIEKKNLVAMTVFLKFFPENSTLVDKIIYTVLNYIVFINNNIFRVGASSGEFQMMKVSGFKSVNGFNEDLVAGEDFDMFKRLSLIGKTYCEKNLVVLHTGRRPHKVGWVKVLGAWFMNWFHSTFFKKSYSKVWEEVR